MCLGDYHGALYLGEGGKKLSLDIPSSFVKNTLGKFVDVAPKGKFGLKDNNLFLLSEEMDMRLGYMAVADPNEEAINYITTDKAALRLVIDREELDRILGNMFSVFMEGSILRMLIEKDQVTLESKTDNGSIKDSLKLLEGSKVKGSHKIHASLPIIQEMLSKTKGKTVKIGVHNNAEGSLHNLIIRSDYKNGKLFLIGTLMNE
jgi:hypothetical protein